MSISSSPYINAETTGGGLPGWGTYTPGLWRTDNASYVEAYQPYIKAVGGILAKNQITNGGPIILVQVRIFADMKCIRSLVYKAENEYSGFQPPYGEDFAYEAQLLKDFVSYVSTNAAVLLIFLRGAQVSWFLSRRTMLGLEDTLPVSISMVRTFNWCWEGRITNDSITGYDSYPNGFDCAHPNDWLPAAVPEYAQCLPSASDV